jgi:osmoprotectant transport system ATP-binding protein
LLKFNAVTKNYGSFTAVKNLNLHVHSNEFVVLIGPSGCGKTTTLKMVNRLETPTSGNIEINGVDIQKSNPVTLRREIGYVIQQIGLFPNMTIAQNIDVVPRLLGWDDNRRRKRVEELLEMVNMDPATYMDRFPNELSGGQQQRIGVLRALAAEPPLILMDEPFGALDPITREGLQDELKKLQNEIHKTIIFVTHDMDEALKLADRIVIMKDGEVIQDASPESLLRNPANDFVEAFIGKKRLNNFELEQVDQVMIDNPVTVSPRLGMAEALAIMKRRKVDMVLVVDDKGSFLGIASLDSISSQYNTRKSIGDIATKDIPVIDNTASAREAFDLIDNEKLRYLPVVDQNRLFVGLVTRNSMVNAMASVVWGDNDDQLN